MTEREKAKAYKAAGYRERTAMSKSSGTEIIVGGHRCIKFEYSTSDPFQDGNGALWDINMGAWRN